MQLLEAVVNSGLKLRAIQVLVALSILAVLPMGILGQNVGQHAHPAQPGTAVQVPPTTTAPADPNAPKLRCDETTHDFGEVWSGEIVEHAYVIHNDGKSPLELLNVRASCGCTVVDFDKVIAPGSTGKATAKLNTTRMAQMVSKSVTVESNDPARRTTTLILKGKVKPRVSVEPINAAFGNVTDETDVTRVIKVTNHTEEKMKLEPVAAPPGQKSVFNAQITELEPGKIAEIKVTGVRPFAEGSNSTILRFQTGIEKEKEIAISCSLYSPPLIQIMPMMLPMAVPVARDFVRSVTVVYNGKGEFAIESVNVPNDAVDVQTVPPMPNTKAYRLNVRVPQGFDPPSDDPIDITIKTNLKEKPELKLTLKPTRVTQPPGQPLQQPQQPTSVTRLEDAVGKPTPITNITSISGGAGTQLGTNSQVAVVNFWAVWSANSRRQLGLIQSLTNQYGRKPVTFVNVSVDSLKQGKEVIDTAMQHGVGFSSLATDPRQMIASRFGVRSVPTMVLIGKNGIIEAVHEGLPGPEGMAEFEKMLRAELDALVENKTRSDFPAQAAAAARFDPLDPQLTGQQPLAPTPRLMVESFRQDVGELKPGAPVTIQVYYRNGGLQPLNLASVKASEGLSVQPGYAATLQPGSVGVLICRFNAAQQAGVFEHKLTIDSNDSARPKTDILITGGVRPYLEYEPKTGIDFGRNPRTQTMGRMATILYNGEGEIEYQSAESSSPKFEAKVEKLKSSQNAKLVVEPKPPFDLGELTAVIKVKTTCQTQPAVEVPLKLYNPKRVEVSPEAVTLDGATRQQKYTVTIANNGLEDLHILGVAKSSNRIRTQFYPDADGFSYKLDLTLPVNYMPAAGGDTITIRTSDQEFKEIVIPIKAGT